MRSLKRATVTPEDQEQPSQSNDLIAGRYRLENRIGRGANAVVIRAMDTLLQIPVALKVLRQLSLKHKGLSEELKVNLRSEAIASMRLSHPHIIRVHTYEADRGQEFLVMEYVDGENARQRQRRFPQQRLPVREVAQLGLKCLKALSYAHGLGVIHHDIKPSNILISNSAEIKLCDFGLARHSTSPWVKGVVAGTPGFISPERMQGESGDMRSDLYSLSATLYNLGNGHSPYGKKPQEVQRALLSGRPPEQGAFPDVLYAVLLRGLSLRPTERFQSAEEMRKALHDAYESFQRESKPSQEALSQLSIPPPRSNHTEESEESLNISVSDLVGSSSWSWLEKRAEEESLSCSSKEPLQLSSKEPLQSPPSPAPRQYALSDGRLNTPSPPHYPRPAPNRGWTSEEMRLIPPMRFYSLYNRRSIRTQAFFLSAQLVSNREYSDFIKATEGSPPSYWLGREPPPGFEKHPVVEINLEEARAYARWTGGRLPNSEEWEAACRGLEGRRFPWGNTWDSARCHCRESGARGIAPIGSYPQGASQEGCLDLLGNVWEWSELVPEDLPSAEGQVWSFGGSYRHDCKDSRGVVRKPVLEKKAYGYLGFRCAMSLPH